MKKKVLKVVVGVSFAVFATLAFTKSINNYSGDNTLSNIIALNSANAEETVTCTQPPNYPTVCHNYLGPNGELLATAWGKKVE